MTRVVCTSTLVRQSKWINQNNKKQNKIPSTDCASFEHPSYCQVLSFLEIIIEKTNYNPRF